RKRGGGGRNGVAKETKWDGTGGRESEHSIVPGKRGNAASGPRGGKGVPNHGTVGGKHGGCLGTRSRVNETTTDSTTGEARPAEGILRAGAPHPTSLAAPGVSWVASRPPP